MALFDHFHLPLSDRRHWHSFHKAWACNLSAQLNSRLPTGYSAEPNVQFGIEIDVAAFTDVPPAGGTASPGFPAEPVTSFPLMVPEAVVEITVFSRSGGPTLAGAIELVSPANKDRPAHRDAFVSKAAVYVQAGVGLGCV